MARLIHRLARLFCLVLLVVSTAVHADTVSNHSYFLPRAISRNTVLERALSAYRIRHADYVPRDYEEPTRSTAFNVQTSFFYQESSSAGDLARYFLLNGDKELTVDEKGLNDIGSEWLGLSTTTTDFLGEFSIRPQREAVGVTVHYHWDVSNVVDGLWIEAWMAFMHVEHDLKFRECVDEGEAREDTFETISEALNNPFWCFGKWKSGGACCPNQKCVSATTCNGACPTRGVRGGNNDCEPSCPKPSKCNACGTCTSGSLSKTGIDDLLLKLGYSVVRQDDVRVDIYGELLVPLNESQTAEFVFEPMIGNGGHVGLGAGIFVDGEWDLDHGHFLAFLGDIRYRYLFSSTEKRSFDVKGKPFSRYMFYNREGDDQFFQFFASNGINLFTEDLRVRPGSQIEGWFAGHYRYQWINAECGYNFSYRSRDDAELKCTWQHSDSAISALFTNEFFPDAQISDNPPTIGTGPFTPILQSDLDFSVAEHPSSTSHTLFIAASANEQFFGHPGLFGIGFSYQFADGNTAMDMWTIWASLSTGF